MAKLYSLEDWEITDKSIKPSKRKVILRIYTAYPDLNQYINLPPEARVKQRDVELRKNYTELKKYFGKQIIKKNGSHKSPRGAKVETTLKLLKAIEKMSFIGMVFIDNIEGAIKKESKPKPKFWCVKAHISLQVEGIATGRQYYEEHYLLIKAFKNDIEAKAQKFYDNYEQIYFNSDCRRVRWKLEKIIDIYETDTTDSSEFDNPEGTEVFSTLELRKMKPEYYWDGNE